jgi:hypothetical protein
MDPRQAMIKYHHHQDYKWRKISKDDVYGLKQNSVLLWSIDDQNYFGRVKSVEKSKEDPNIMEIILNNGFTSQISKESKA